MQTVEFLEKIWPSDGAYLIAYKTDKGFRHNGYTTVEEAAVAACALDAKGHDVFFACSAFQSIPYRDEDGKWVTRTKENWLAAKAFWCDVDCGEAKAEAGIGYATQGDGIEAVDTWCAANNLPLPLVVNSGHGIHCYWPLTEPLEPAQWVQAAGTIKASMKDSGVLADPTRTADFSSVLRPVGTHNHKDNPLLVELVRDAEPIDTPTFIAALANLVAAGSSWMDSVPEYLRGEAHEAMPQFAVADYSANLVADKCAQVRAMRDTQGDVPYEVWRGTIGIIKFCREGEPLAHEWSARRAETGHRNIDVALKYNTWTAAPTTCGHFETHGDMALCASCPFHGKIKTPLVLGREMPEPKAEVVEATEEGDERKTAVAMEVPELPKGYEWNNGLMVHWVKDKDNNLQAKPFCRHRFYLVGRICNHLQEYEYVVRLHLPNNSVRTFNLPGEIIGKGGANLFGALGAKEIFLTSNADAGQHMCAYLKDQVSKIMAEKEIMPTYSHFGWQDDGSFLIGTRLYREDGVVSEALLSGYAYDKKDNLPSPRGSLEAYVDALNWVYDREGMEPMQYVICSMLASPLVKLYDTAYAGIPVAPTGASSGKGKTTACVAALYAFGDAVKLTIAGDYGATGNARSALLGTMSDLPVLFDEVTNMEPRKLSELAYALSNGMERERLKVSQGGVRFANREVWHMQCACTGNTYIGARLSQNGQAEAEAMRIFEMRVDGYPIPQLEPIEVAQKLDVMARNAGCAGERFIKWLVTHKAVFRQVAKQMLDMMKEDVELIANPKYRFFRNHVVLTLSAALILKKIGIVRFNLDRLSAFAFDAMRSLCTYAQDTNGVDYDGALSQMIDFYQGDILQTPTLKLESGHAPYQFHPKNSLVGRAITSGKERKLKDTLFLSAKAINEWCTRNRVDAEAFASYLSGKGILLQRGAKLRLTVSTNLVSTQQRCWVFDLRKLDANFHTALNGEEDNG